MKIWLIEQDENNNYDTYDSVVVVSASEDGARNMNPDGSNWGRALSSWASSPDKVKVTCIGDAAEGLEEGQVICSSFNAG